MNEKPLNSQIEPSMDEAFLQRIKKLVLENLKSEDFSPEWLAKELGYSRSQVHRKLKRITGKSVSHLICEIRLEEALKLLNGKVATSSEIAYRVGFSSPNYFSKCFHNYYGTTPGEVLKMEEPFNISPGVEKKHIQKKPWKRGKVYAFISLLIIIVIVVYYIIGSMKQSSDISGLEKTLIVLPFIDLSEDQNNQWLADGFAEDIINSLSNISSLSVFSRSVFSRSSSEQYRESILSAPETAKKMKVNYILEGSIRRIGNKIRITILLIDANSGINLWSQNFDRELSDIIGIQSDIALQVADKLNEVLTDDEIRQIKKIPTQNPEAYTYYLQARFLLHKANDPQRSDFDKKSVMNCIQYYEKAIAEDENFAEAYAGLANAWFNLTAWGWLSGGFAKARELSMKALEIDPECAEAHAVLGAYFIWGERDFEEGGKELETSIQLNPNFSTSRQWYAQFLMMTGPIEDARQQMDRALELEPYFWVIQNLNSFIYYFEEKFGKALEACIVANDYNPNSSDNDWLFVLNYAKLGEGEKVVQQLQSIAKRYSGTDKYANEIQEAYRQSGINGLFTWLIDVNTNKPIPVQGLNGHPFYNAWWNAILGNKDESIYWLEKNMQENQIPSFYFDLIATNPDFDFLRDDPRFLKIVDEIGLTPYHKRKAK